MNNYTKNPDGSVRHEYERNVIYRSDLTGQFYFAKKVRVLTDRLRVVVGEKIDVTDQLQPFLLKRFRRKVAR